MVPAEELEFDTDKEPWTVYRLEDGTLLKFKQVLSKACRLIDKFKPNGEPIYVFNLGAITISEVPTELKKKAE
jgi:hypothetical protein